MVPRPTLVILALLALGHQVLAQSSDDADKVDDLIRKGVELRKRGDDHDALGMFQRAYAAAVTPRAAAQLALAEQALGRWVAAEGHLSEALRSQNDPWVRKNQTTLKNALTTIQTHLGSIEVTGSPTGADVYVDGQLAGKLPLADPVRVAVGQIEVELRAPRFITSGKTVAVHASGYERVFVGLYRQATVAPPAAVAPAPTAAASTPPAAKVPQSPTNETVASGADVGAGSSPRGPSSLRSSYKWIAWGASAIGLGFGIYGTVENGDRTDTFNVGCRLDNGTAVSRSTRMYDATCNSLKNSYQSAATIGIVGFVAAGVLAAAGASLWLTEPKPQDDKIALRACSLFGSGAAWGAACALRF